MQITIEKATYGFLAFGEGLAFFAPTRAEAVQKLIEEAEKNPLEEGVQYMELTDMIANVFGLLNHPEVATEVMMNLRLRPMAVQTKEESEVLQAIMAKQLEKTSLGLSAISAAVSDHLSGKKRIIILQQL